MSFGQGFATANSADKFVEANATGEYSFTLPDYITQKDVALSAEYYTVYFTVNFNEKNHVVTVKLTGLEEKNRQVIQRFFISLGVRDIQYEGKIYPIQDFYTTFLKSRK
jgi:hypothetical protein